MIYILLPSYNEEKNLKKMCQKIERIYKKIDITIVLVDDCSTDNTILLMKKKYKFNLVYIKHKRNRGLSITMETGFNKILKLGKEKDVVITLDSDNTHPISIIPGMVKKIYNGNDIVIASRFVNTSKIKGVIFWRHFLSVGAKYLFRLFYSYKNLNDYTCNFRAYKFKLIKELLRNKKFFKNEDFNIAAKILLYMMSSNKNLRISEYPLILNYHYKIGSSKMSVLKNIYLTLRLIILKKF
jgi:dolichol-phosphate mannosyltransferase